MQSLAYVPGGNGAANPSLMTVSQVRAPGATTNTVNTVAGVPTKFYGTMGAPHTFTDPVTGETITVISDATAVDFAGTINAGKIDIVAIAPGYSDTRGSLVGDIIVVRPITEWANNLFNVLSQSLNDDGTLKTSAMTYLPNASDYIDTGGIWSFTAATLTGAMTALTAYQGGYLGAVSAIASRVFTASKDTYVDLLRTTTGTTTTFSIVYTEVANGAAAPALAANSIRLAKLVSGASAITSVINSGMDSLKNLFHPYKIGTIGVDANGWVRQSMGKWNKYTLNLSTTNVGIGAGAAASFGTQSLPEGIIDSSYLRFSYGTMGGYEGRIHFGLDNGNTLSAVTTIVPYLYNATAGTISWTGFCWIYADTIN